MQKRTLVPAIATLCAAAFTLAGCGSQSKSAGSDSNGPSNNAIVTAYDNEPQNPLSPGASGESGGIRVADEIYSGLVTYNKSGAIKNEMASSIKPNADSTQFTITIKDGWKFSNGTPVTAQSFTKAWSYAAVGSNGMKNAWCFSAIKGYDDVQDKNTPSDAQLSGLKVVDPHTFTVDMNEPDAVFPTQLGYIAFAPLPESAFKDMKAFGNAPVTNGPYKLTSWAHNKSITLSKNPDYQGPRKPKNNGIKFQIYTKADAAYSDVQAGNLDVLDKLPSSALKSFQSDASMNHINVPGASFGGFTIPSELEHFKMDKEGRLRRQAMSLAINRKLITTKIFQGTRTPATDFLAPPVSGYSKTLKGNEVLRQNTAKAKQLWKEADTISPYSGTFEIAYNSDSDHKPWIDAVCNQLKNALGINAEGKAFPTAAEFYDTLDSKTPTFAFYTSWGADWPSAQNFLVTLYASSSADGKGSNTGNYKNPDFDKLMDQAAASSSLEKANSFYQQGEEILFQDLPTIPLWYGNATAVTTKSISNLQPDFSSLPLYWAIVKK
ncbi:ABC transporter substrate-binding protein [Bifidobacterium sp. ESL0732]|uniref:peptide ABC transporter substrate-binding protein n=1 Tax=Bifidobacterium sp. ESL0732 TaxID=2983222 RepID=UPI0023F872DD|nr:ABC transporter substrate-binding protein [Bifidobacterium sp. ESL0732]WEV64010.1 ABC transporter substrate-binding protein [Bifidobacterium sp. ESL0732]